MKRVFLFLGMLLQTAFIFAQFDGPVGTEGCKAVAISDSRIVSWAYGVQVKRGFTAPNGTTRVSYGTPDMAQGVPDSTTTTAISLGFGGEALVTFDRPIVNGRGYDFAVFENPFGPNFLELAFVEVSSDGEHFFRFPATSLSTGSSDVMAQHYNNLAGKYEVGYGTPFDLSELPDDANLDKMNIRYVKLIDVTEGVDTDAQGNVIYDSPCAGSYSAGFDLTGVAVMNGGVPYVSSSCESIVLAADSHDLISATNGTLGGDGNYYKDYIDGEIAYEAVGLYGGSFACGFGPSNHTTAAGYYSSASLQALEGAGSNYMVGYYSDNGETPLHNVIRKADNSTFFPQGIYVAPSTAMYNDYKNNFHAGDWETITATAYDAAGNTTGSTTIYLADFRTSYDTTADLVKEWVYMDLLSLGECNKIVFTLASNNLSYGYLNASSYFCVDGFTYKNDNVPFVLPMDLITLAATEVTEETATLNGDLFAGTETVTARGFEYKTADEQTWTSVTSTDENDVYAVSINGLVPDTEYTFRAFATNDGGNTVYGEELTFRTLTVQSLAEAQAFSFRLYPNPASGVVNIELEDGTSAIKIFDMQSRQVFAGMANGNCELNLSLPSGVYVLTVEKDGMQSSKKLFVR